MKIIHYFLSLFIALMFFSCVDNDPVIEELPNPDIAFNYSVIDAEYQIDYYVGANIEFVSSSVAPGECSWDFGDGTMATGETVTHKYKKAGTYAVKLTIAGAGYQSKPILISDIKPIVSPNKTGLIEVVSTSVGFNVELPNPEKLTEEYHWIFPDGTLDAAGNPIATFDGKNPGNVTFSNIGSQTVTLQVKLGGRQLEDGVIKVPVAYNKAVPTLYYAVKGGNIMALKLVTTAPAGMKINPFDMGTKSGQHPLNILFNDTSLYVLDCGRQFTYVDDKD
ncbi:MAG TPA: PKD domain-containing protein, partial [Paludibacteraceae bacterium]|nr:PKD domain-containing protein [Paludibacteraceae bacterium]